jgi:ABC-type antimicrobial peptide transport system permease subunit
VSSLVWRHGARLSIVGGVIGLLVAPVIGRSVAGALFGVEGVDAGVLVRAALAVVAACALGCVIPAWRASRLDPLKALRQD